MASVKEIRQALATTVASIPDLRAFATTPGEIEPPAALIRPETLTYAATMPGGPGVGHDMTFGVLILVSKTWERTAQDRLDQWIDPQEAESVYGVINNDPDLGGVVSSAVATVMRNYGPIDMMQGTFIAAEVLVEVMT